MGCLLGLGLRWLASARRSGSIEAALRRIPTVSLEKAACAGYFDCRALGEFERGDCGWTPLRGGDIISRLVEKT